MTNPAVETAITPNTYKYDWERKDIKQWMDEAKNAFANEFSKITKDYEKYLEENFSMVEEKIAANLFDITPEFAMRAYRGSSLLPFFTIEERSLVRRIRQRLQEVSRGRAAKSKEKKVSGTKGAIEIEFVPIALRLDEDLKIDEDENGEKKAKREPNNNSTTGRIFVFRVKCPDGTHRFVDCETRVYQTWIDYLTENHVPQCIMCYPKDGFTRMKDKDTNQFVPSDVEFCEPRSCSDDSLKVLDRITVFSTPFFAIGTILCPAGWAVTASAISYISLGLSTFSFRAQIMHCWDKWAHGQKYGAEVLTCVASIAATIASFGLPHYLKHVARSKRALCTAENVIITGVLWGLSAKQAISFFYMTANIVTKPKIEPIDIVRFVVACHNLYSCVLSPKKAAQLLEKVRAQLQTENLQLMEKNKMEIDAENENIAANVEKLDELITSNGDKEIIAQMEKAIEDGRAKVQQLADNIQQREYECLENAEEWMTKKFGKEEYNRFEAETTEDISANSEIHQNARIVKVMTNMDAEKVFTMVSETGSRIQFANGETLDIIDNSQLEIHPQAIDQINRIPLSVSSDNVGNMTRLLKDYATKSISEGDYLKKNNTSTQSAAAYAKITNRTFQNIQKISYIGAKHEYLANVINRIKAYLQPEHISETREMPNFAKWTPGDSKEENFVNLLLRDNVDVFNVESRRLCREIGDAESFLTIYDDGKGYVTDFASSYDAVLGRTFSTEQEKIVVVVDNVLPTAI